MDTILSKPKSETHWGAHPRRDARRRVKELKEYLRKHQLLPFQIASEPSSELGLIVVIPCYDEPALLATLRSLDGCAPPPCDTEVLVVVNARADDTREVHERNRRTAEEARQWISGRGDRLQCHLLDFPDLPSRHAGVGFARKLGMDEAAARLAESREARGIIACLDADCLCDTDYFIRLYEHFAKHESSPAASIYFEHPLEGDSGAIAAYELFLRYYVEALRYSGFPHAFHTVGSCMAVRSEAYVRAGGMNRRQAGEDFYFLHKLTAQGPVSEILDTTVYPAARVSSRVPFGTGRAISRRLTQTREAPTYAPEVFADLKAYFSRVDDFFYADPGRDNLLHGLPHSVTGFLARNGFVEKLREIRGHTASLKSFRKRFFQWQNGFRTMKYVHYATEHVHRRVPVSRAAATMLAWRAGMERARPGSDVLSLLEQYRALARTGTD